MKTEYNRLSDFSEREIKKMSELIRVLENDNNKINMERAELENQLNIKQEEIHSLIESSNSLER